MDTAYDQYVSKLENLPEIKDRVTDVVVKKWAGRNGAVLLVIKSDAKWFIKRWREHWRGCQGKR